MAALRIAEIFTSIQGEGQWLGVPSTFVRVSGCNLRCSWCDTPYASWNPEGPVIPIADIADQVTRTGIDHVVLTGGEPMIFEPIEQLAKILKQSGHVITIETAGTRYRSLACDLMSVSPKLSNSTPDGEWGARHDRERLDLETLRRLCAEYNYQLKFVVCPQAVESQIEEIERLVTGIGGVEPNRVFLMPEGVCRETVREGARTLTPLCIDRGWRLSPRLHIELFGNQRGT